VGFLDYLRKAPHVLAGIAIAFECLTNEVKRHEEERNEEEKNREDVQGV